MYLRICRGFKASNWVRKSQIRKLLKVYGPQIANYKIFGRYINKKYAVLRFAEFFCELPTFSAKHWPPAKRIGVACMGFGDCHVCRVNFI
jgi:hypothetical protein